MNFLDTMSSGGPVMWFILALSVAAVACALERASYLALLRAGPTEGRARRPYARIYEAAHDNWALPHDALLRVVEGAVRDEVHRCERGLGFIEAVGRIAPMLGLLGTVLGMNDMFSSLGGGGSAEAVSGGISTALLTTIAGLCAAIPALAVHALLSGAVDRQADRFDRLADGLIASHARGDEPER